MLDRSHKAAFSRFHAGAGDRLHFAAHSHHWWPDATRAAQQQAWDDAARLADGKWEHVFGTVLAEAQGHVARVLGLPDAATVAFAPNVHDLLLRVASAVERAGPLRLLSTGSEFHSFTRQARRWVEAGRATWTEVPSEPFDTLPSRFAAAAASGAHDLLYASHVFFDSGAVFEDVFDVLASAPGAALRMVDAYHGFMALPTDLGPYADRLFYAAGGYKYAMSGEGCCFLHCPPGVALRPVDTGWFAGFGALAGEQDERVAYAAGGGRFLGATFDPVGVYRFNAVQRWLLAEGLGVADLHARARRLQERFLDAVAAGGLAGLALDQLVPGRGARDRGHFLTFRRPDAAELERRLDAAGVAVDRRADRLRIGFGLYHDAEDVDRLVGRLATLAP